jgi:hypothetical protein
LITAARVALPTHPQHPPHKRGVTSHMSTVGLYPILLSQAGHPNLHRVYQM